MNERKDLMLDAEFGRYLKIVKPYIGQLFDKDVIEICNAWIHKLTNCNNIEKSPRNKYIFTLCYQLARGSLHEPFTRYPSSEILKPLSYESDDDTFSDIEDQNMDITDLNQIKGNILMKSLPRDPVKETILIPDRSYDSMASSTDGKSYSCNERTDVKQNEFISLKPRCFTLGSRVKNLIFKLRDIKKENSMLRDQLFCLKNEIKNGQDYNVLENSNNNAANLCPNIKCSSDMHKTISSLEEKLNHFNEIKTHEIETLIAKHNLEILKLKTGIKMKVVECYENKIHELAQKHENTVENIRRIHVNTLEKLRISHENKLYEKDEIIKSKSKEILCLNKKIEESESQYSNVHRDCSIQKLEERVSKIEKSKNIYLKSYESKLSNIRRKKNMNECSLQLQLLKQKTQIVSEITDENQTDLLKALEKLENKYKNIVAKVQATALHRRIHDQLVLETLMKTVCDIPSEGNFKENYQLNGDKIMTHPDGDVYTNHICHSNGAGITIGNRLTKMENTKNEVYHDSKDYDKLFKTIHIPQKDICNNKLPKY